jgi:hypothetical protein
MVTLYEVLKQAETEGVAVGHFNVSDSVTLKAVFESASDQNVPVIVGVSEGERQFLGVRQIVYPFRLFTEVGGLLSYGNNFIDNFSGRGGLCGSHFAGREAERASRPGPGQVRAGDQSQDCEGARPRRAFVPSAAR